MKRHRSLRPNIRASIRFAWRAAACAGLLGATAACQGGSSGMSAASAATGMSAGATTTSAATGMSASATTTSIATGMSAGATTTSAATGASAGATATSASTAVAAAATAAGPAAKLAAKLGRPAQLLVGLGGQGTGVNAVSAIESQAVKIDIYERYLGVGDWTSWNSLPCDYVCVVADAAEAVGAIPMYTQYQMANNGDGNIAVVNDSAFMQTYWARAKRLFQGISNYGKPALVNLEPDFWGYVEQHAPGGDPSKMTALVKSNPDCTNLPNNITGLAHCLLQMARKYAPKASVGFPPSSWGGRTTADVVTFMNALGAQGADFIVEQTLDRDAGCFEIQASGCTRSGSGWYWDETNVTHPNFQDHLAEARAYHTGIGNLPLIWWQTPLGTPSSARGGSAFHYRDNRMHYFLTHPAELVAAGGLGVVFSTGADRQTNINTDAGEFQALDDAYRRSPATLP